MTGIKSELHAAALAYAKLGWAVHPLRARDKRPASKHGHKDASSDPQQINAWWNERPRLNVGIATGTISGLVVVDIDPGGAEELARLEDQHGPLRATITALTGRDGGCHLYFSHPGNRVPSRSGVIGDAIDVRGDGGYVVAPPSRHPDGPRYRWRAGRAPSEVPLQTAPSWLLELMLPPASARSSKYGTGALSSAVAEIRGAREGTRNDALFRAAAGIFELVEGGELDASTANREVLQAALDAGLPADEAQRTLESARAQVRGKPRTRPEPRERNGKTRKARDRRPRTDLGNAERLVDQHGRDLRFCALLGGWFVWDGKRWSRDETGQAFRFSRSTVRNIYEEARSIADEDERTEMAKHAVASERGSRIKAMVELAQSDKAVALAHDAFDREPLLFNAQNCCIDLTSGDARDHSRSDLLTKISEASYSESAQAPRWQSFLDEVLPEREVQTFLQRFVGYSLTGTVREHVLVVLYGTGANGKTTFMEVVHHILGDYFVQANPDLLLQKPGMSHPTERATLRGRRLAVCSETDAGRTLAEGTIKMLTGGNTINARKMRQDEFVFQPTHKLVMETNHKPRVRGTDEGIWRRILLVPFVVTVPEADRDPRLTEKLKAEAVGILRWAVEGCLEWQRRGLDPPPAVRKRPTTTGPSKTSLASSSMNAARSTAPRRHGPRQASSTGAIRLGRRTRARNRSPRRPSGLRSLSAALSAGRSEGDGSTWVSS